MSIPHALGPRIIQAHQLTAKCGTLVASAHALRPICSLETSRLVPEKTNTGVICFGYPKEVQRWRRRRWWRCKHAAVEAIAAYGRRALQRCTPALPWCIREAPGAASSSGATKRWACTLRLAARCPAIVPCILERRTACDCRIGRFLLVLLTDSEDACGVDATTGQAADERVDLLHCGPHHLMHAPRVRD